MLQRPGKLLIIALSVFAAVFVAGADRAYTGPQQAATSRDPSWRRTVMLAAKGDFRGAAAAIGDIHDSSELTAAVRSWLEEYETKQADRRAMDAADLDKYVRYAKARIERHEYLQALEWVLAASNCTEDRQAFLESDWLKELVKDAIAAAETSRGQRKWRDAWRIYSYLGVLYEHEPRYQKLEREVLTHYRFDTIFKDDGRWLEQLEGVRWNDAERAMEYVESQYVEPVDFRKVAEAGLEQLLLLAESKAAQEKFEGLANENNRNDFILRVREHLNQVRASMSVDRADCVRRFRRIVEKINAETVHLPEELLVDELMRGALSPLDEFTGIIWPRDAEEFEKHTRGDFPGVGISIVKNNDDEVEVVSPLEDTPAYRAGIQAGDVITKVDGRSLKGYSLNRVVESITGQEGTQVVLTIRRSGKEIEFPLVRARVRIRSVKGLKRLPIDEERWEHWLDRELGIGYIRVANFQKNTVEDVDGVLRELTGLRGLVLDLRRNPGGLLDSAYLLSSLFLKRGETVVSTKARIRSENQTFEVRGDGPYSDLPLVVLVDEGSASASEIVSGALRDNRRGTVVGERTFGKFSVQNLIGLGRSGAKLKITTARYYLPNGDSLHRDPAAATWGVLPDVPVRLADKETIKVYQMWRDADLLGPPKIGSEQRSSATPAEQTPENMRGEVDESANPSDGISAGSVDAPLPPPIRVPLAEPEAGAPGGESQVEGPPLPPLAEPDENDRPKADPQVDTALLLLRILLAAEAQPTIATAEVETPKDTARP